MNRSKSNENFIMAHAAAACSVALAPDSQELS
jgi:hypothetical protein